jgi:ABC-type proline/glycine betaine transport system ATPase subunit
MLRRTRQATRNDGLRKSVFGGKRITFIDDGRIIDQGPPGHVFHESPEPRVRQFPQTYTTGTVSEGGALPRAEPSTAESAPSFPAQLCAAFSLSIGKPRWCQTG